MAAARTESATAGGSESARLQHGLADPAAEHGVLPIAPSLEKPGDSSSSEGPPVIDGRVLWITVLAIGIAILAALTARLLTALIGFVTNFAFYGRFSTSFASPAGNHLGPFVVFVPVVGSLIVGLMARYGSRAIRGHGIPEAMEQVLTNESRIPPRITFLKPLSAAVAIGTGGPFGAEGPIIATGGALGSVVGQLLKTTAQERKVLLAAGAAAGMTATFGTPVAAVLLAVELLLFEFRPHSLIPVAFAAAIATEARYLFEGSAKPVFAVAGPPLTAPAPGALVAYIVLGLLVGLAAVGVTRLIYWIEDLFERLPIHWMWWPALGAVAVGIAGWLEPRTLGVGYTNIEQIVSGSLAGRAVLALCLFKLLSWSISLSSGTSGGTLAPLLTIGGGMGLALGEGAVTLFPQAKIDPRVCALVGMAALFTGASRALLASVVFAFETTLQPLALLPLAGGCTAAFLVSCLLMRHSIMTEKIARRGIRVPTEYVADFLEQVTVRESLRARPNGKKAVTLRDIASIQETREWLDSGAPGSSHQGYPVVDAKGRLLGVLTRRNLLASGLPEGCVADLIHRPPVVITADASLREAADRMVREGVGRLPVVEREAPDGPVSGILTRSDLLAAHARRLRETHHAVRHLRVRHVMQRRLPRRFHTLLDRK